jgi:two-component system cell cycle sensor histidine kinase/response regulator CckA
MYQVRKDFGGSKAAILAGLSVSISIQEPKVPLWDICAVPEWAEMASDRAQLAINKNTLNAHAAIDADKVLAHLKKVESRQWWLWASAIVVTLLLTGGLLSFTFPFLFEKGEASYVTNLQLSLRGLVGLVMLFDIYAFYQQLQIHRVRKQLYESQKLFHLIGENAEDLIAVVDASGNRLFNSPSYERILGYTSEELKASARLEQVHPEDRERVMEAAREARRTGIGRQLEYRFKHKDGSWRTLESTASAVRNSKGEINQLVIVNRDVTERKKSEEVLRLKEDQLRQSQKMEAVGRLSGGIAHDFNNLLGVIIGYSDVLEIKLEGNEALRKNVAEIKKAGTRASSLTRQLLAFSRQQVLQPKILDLNSVVNDLAKMLKRLIGEDIEIEIVSDLTLGKVKADHSQLDQIIMNLVVNARDAMPDGGKLTIQTSNVELGAAAVAKQPYIQTGPYVQLSVTDTGIGMDAATMAHIFEPFFTTKEKGKGTGLGLATVYGVVKQSDGYIWVDSEPGKGTTFKICLPEAVKAVVEAPIKSAPARAPRGSETVLLAEDEDSLRALISDLLQQNGYKVLVASCGLQAMKMAESYDGPIHLLLTDVVMPGMGGPALAKNLAAARPDTKILFMSGYIEFHSAGSSQLPPDAHMMQKPFSNETLIREVGNALGVHELQVCS